MIDEATPVIDYKGKMEGEVVAAIVPRLCGCLEKCDHEDDAFNSEDEDDEVFLHFILS